MLVVQAADTAPGGVLGEEDHEDVEAGCRYDGESPQDAENPVAGLVAAARACVGPTGQKSRRGEEDDEEQTGQPGGLRGTISILSKYSGIDARSRINNEKANAQGARRNRSRIARRENRAPTRPSTA